ncbi:hypothetical protein [Bacteroides sp. 224]|uniref:hypothetical protein n=1 Tax=Bacteroides sp. 224 TaxID=2302936 RepID=UPI0013D66090|nr:hypothetical protein [Bacteroides sp. 224]NDV66502.1 hypothetical protein [Bacteroides sp. 224]
MKFKFKYVSMLVMAAMMAGFTACSDKDAVVEGTDGTGSGDGLELREDDLTIQITVPTASKGTRGESTTNVGIAPHVFDMTLVFVGKTVSTLPEQVLAVIEGDVASLTGAGQKFKALPLGVTGLYVIGNTNPAKYDANVITGYESSSSTIKDDFGVLAMKNAAKRKKLLDYNPKETPAGSGTYTYVDVETFMKEVRISLDNYNLKDAKAVNITGYAPITATQGTTPVRVVVTPAISRYEIAEIKSSVDFAIKGIYISNTMREISVDGQQYPNPVQEPEMVLNYGWNNPAWNYSLWKWDYTAYSPKDPNNFGGSNAWYEYKVDAEGDAITRSGTYAESHNYTKKGDLNYDIIKNAAIPTARKNQERWAKWYETDLSKAVKSTVNGVIGYRPSDRNYYWSFYIASARKQDDPNSHPITNPYLDEGVYNRVGLKCGDWAYTDEEAAVEKGDVFKALGTAYAVAAYPGVPGLDMEVPDWATRGTGIQYGTFPTICIDIDLATANSHGLKRGWYTITKFLDAANGLPLQYPKPGTVYVIKAINIDADKLTPDPMWPKEETDISVEVIVEGWVGQDTIVE